ncbi:ligand-binding sensor domain-containing protein [Mucilaginibacter dorajii]|uniref:Histidine kinase domain-containing protein n=1 Tax=Mucilaginibacter dorajii TaxID=692994 RepID=A0ABP7QB41_9SPHI|nr:two-component regulator propeller domain-containing protein [Mucilaginibacter dorajii]MCS3733103.1 ligand-binding sensor domain-containing protein [Mucilaginibacter dorajii]
MNKIQNAFLTIALLFCCLFASAQYTNVFFNNAGINQGLSQSSVVDIAFDSKGFAWLATQDGLNRYDGIDFLIADKKFDDITSGFNNKLGKIIPADGHFLWVISKGGNLEKLNLIDGIFIPVNIISGKVKQVLTCMLTDDYGKLWLGTASGKLILYDNNTGKIAREFNVPTNKYHPAINALYRDYNKRLWILGTTLNYLENDELKPFECKTEKPDKTILYSCITQDKAGNMWLGSWGNGLFLKRKNENCFKQFNGYGKGQLSPSLVIEAMLADYSGKVWFGTYGDGLFIVDNKAAIIKQLVNDKRNLSSLPFNDVLSIKQDANKGIWIGTDGGGVSYYNESRSNFILFNNQTVPQNVDVALVRSVTTDKNANIWAGTTNNGLTEINYREGIFKTWHFTSYKKDIYNPDRIVSLYNDQQNLLWIGTQDNGLLLFDPVKGKTIKWYHPEASANLNIPDATIWCMYPAANDNVWVGTGNAGLCLLDKQKGLVGNYVPGDNTDAIRTIIGINDTTLGIGFEKTGIGFFNTITKTFDMPQSKKLNTYFSAQTNIKSLYYQKPLLWIGTGGAGIITYNITNGTIRHLTAAEGLPNNTIYGILPDDIGDLWVSTNKGLSRFNPAIINGKPIPSQFTNYTSVQGLQSNEFNTGAYYKSSNGMLLFGGINGLNLFDPSKFRNENKNVSVVFTKILVDNEPVENETAAPFKKTVNLSYQNHSVAFNFAALDFFSPLQFHYYYKLEGYDKAWIDAGQRNYVSYTNVPAGQYNFLIKYVKKDNVGHAAISNIILKISGPVYKKTWFIILAILLFMGVVYGLYRYRIAQLFKLLQIRQRIATDLHDDIGSTLSNINILSELSKKSLENPSQANKFLDRISEEVQTSSQSLDDIIWSINTHNDNWGETFSRMRRYAAEVFENSGILYTIKLEEQAGTNALKMEKRRDVFLIYKEILNNIHKHAGATEVEINMRFNKQQLIMSISDNGKGFDKSLQTHRNGLKNLNNRVARWKGTINIETNKAGTHIHIAI